ncbi:putative two-component histidine kinase [Sphingomonas changbaiensis NBRC 104936]|uniref:histidine kinase n=1 Tax=Sphingomonas changbaiensis NBRC 104936 TaxID=1219043 RepID=A0A0E9MUZ1_9SPHN|nr:HAMP domain-containing sensor histidine kinase [Sphingomonas changbaiensis]GAO40940.1 putative two-component histidine kinase [Sphingomonas changbaiensis NBRC 104936]
MRSAAYRIAFVYSAAFALAIAILGAIIFWAMHVAFTRQLDTMIRDEAAALVSEYRADGASELAEAIGKREAIPSHDRLFYALFDAQGRRISGRLVTQRPALGLHDIVFIDPREGPDAGRGFAVDLGDGERLLVAADRERVEQIDRTVISVFLAGFALVVLLGIAGALLLGGYLRDRLGAISGAAEGVVAGHLGARMPVSERGDEFDRLASSLNAMLERIEGLLENVRQVSSDIAHDLRTPLARLRNQLERGLGGDPAAQHAVIEEGIHRVDDVLALFAAILRIAEIESGKIRRNFAAVDLSALVAELAESYAPAVADGGRTLGWDVEPGIAITGDRELLAQALVNLIENAQRHTPAGTAVRVELAARGDARRLSVSDNGPGVPVQDRERIVQRFIRLEGSRSTPGHGLGLNLVAAVARLHQARLSFGDNRPGLIVTIEFPEDRV